jgi:glycosyltransferase involved in cell wall biosynthesis
MTIYFDITTSLSWGGAQVGITRVEREIARRAAAVSRHKVRHCLYHAATGRYYVLRPEFAAAVLDEGWWIALDVARGLPLKTDMRASRSRVSFGNQTPAREITRLHAEAKALSLAEVLDIRRSSSVVQVHVGEQVRFIPLSDIIESAVPLKPTTWIVNGGLDWEHKNLRHLRKLKAKTGFKYAAVLYDIIPLLFPHYVVPFYVDLLKRYFGELFWTADFGLCISATTRKDIQAHMDRWRMPALPLVDWPLGSDIPQGDDGVGGLPGILRDKSFLLYVSTIEPRKSHRTIVEAFDHGLRNGTIPDDAMCVFVGRVGWNSENLIQEIRNNPALRDRVHILAGIPDAELVSLYRAARFVVFPSRYEGYGLSLVEGMAMGKACISGSAGSLLEVGGDAPLYIDPVDIPAWSAAIAKAFADDDMVRALEARSRASYSPVSWDDSARLFFGHLDAHIEATR